MGPFNLSKWAYDYIYTDEDKGIQWSLDVVSKLMALYGQHPALYAFEPVNEPWWGSDYEVLKSFYRQARTIIRDVNPNVIFSRSTTAFISLFQDGMISSPMMTWRMSSTTPISTRLVGAGLAFRPIALAITRLATMPKTSSTP